MSDSEFATTSKRRRDSVVRGDDGLFRCAWSASDSEYRRYHDEEWGTELHGDRALFEKLSLEGFQAGLSWLTILRRRPAFREALCNFEPEAVAAMSSADVDRLMQNAAIIRNRKKIETTVSNARIIVELSRVEHDVLDALLWKFAPAPARTKQPATLSDVPVTTPESVAMSAALRQLGFRFVGPTTMYALMQSTGMVDDHVAGCWRADSTERRGEE